jgi:hypothetical protein
MWDKEERDSAREQWMWMVLDDKERIFFNWKCPGEFKGKGTQGVQGGQDAGIRSKAGGRNDGICV